MNHTATQHFQNYLGISLWISSTELIPEDITQLVGIQPTYVRLRGAMIAGRNIPRRPEFDVHEWQFRKQFDARSSTDLAQSTEKFITDFLDEIKAHASLIKELSEHHSVKISFVYHADAMPYVGLTRDQVQAIAALGAKLDYDLMIEQNGFSETDEPRSVEVG